MEVRPSSSCSAVEIRVISSRKFSCMDSKWWSGEVYGPFALSWVNGDARSKSTVVDGGKSEGRGPGASGAGLLGGSSLLALADLSVRAGDGGGIAEPRFDDGGTGKSKSSSVRFLALAVVAALADLLRDDETKVSGFAFCGALDWFAVMMSFIAVKPVSRISSLRLMAF
jgi:hypothetical protein